MFNPILLHYCNDYSILNDQQRTVLRDFRLSFGNSPTISKKKKLIGSATINVNVKMSNEEEIDMNTFVLSLSNFGTSFLEIHFSYLTNLTRGNRSSTSISTVLNRIQARQILDLDSRS